MKTCIRKITSVAAMTAAWAMVNMTTALPALAQAAETKPTPTLNSGDTAWMLTSTVLVLMMTIPGLALFYSGMVRKKNALATVMQSFAAACLLSIVCRLLDRFRRWRCAQCIYGWLREDVPREHRQGVSAGNDS